jgi:hypothetical protein
MEILNQIYNSEAMGQFIIYSSAITTISFLGITAGYFIKEYKKSKLKEAKQNKLEKDLE